MQVALRHEEASEAQGKTPYSFPMVQLQAINWAQDAASHGLGSTCW